MNFKRLVLRGILPTIAFALTSLSVTPLAISPRHSSARRYRSRCRASPTVEERLADIEAYMNNVARPEKANEADSLVAGPGPGANAWQMVSTALVLFMTLPGLALVLRRPGPPQERALGAGPVLGHRLRGHAAVVAVRLQPVLRRGQEPVFR